MQKSHSGIKTYLVCVKDFTGNPNPRYPAPEFKNFQEHNSNKLIQESKIYTYHAVISEYLSRPSNDARDPSPNC